MANTEPSEATVEFMRRVVETIEDVRFEADVLDEIIVDGGRLGRGPAMAIVRELLDAGYLIVPRYQ